MAVLFTFGVPIVLILTGILIALAIRGSMRPGPTQLRQDAEARERRGQRTASRRLRTERCDDCRHPWAEHPGAPDIVGDTCSECTYEVEHGEAAADTRPCHERVPSSLLVG